MGLVNGEQRDRHRIEQLQRAVHQQTLRREVQQVELPGPELRFHPPRLVRPQRRVEKRRPDPGLAQRRDLILHQRDQRRDDDAGAEAHQCGNLVAE